VHTVPTVCTDLRSLPLSPASPDPTCAGGRWSRYLLLPPLCTGVYHRHRVERPAGSVERTATEESPAASVCSASGVALHTLPGLGPFSSAPGAVCSAPLVS
jgi:hypothetical protein